MGQARNDIWLDNQADALLLLRMTKAEPGMAARDRLKPLGK